jgi:ABC-type glycerol-3-phosphate transport system permease component
MSALQIGEGFVVLLAGLQDIPRDYYHSAALDGGSRWQLFRFITLPLLAPWLVLLTIRDIILSAQSTFAPAYMMTGGGPYYATFFMPLLIYQEAFDRFRFGHGSALLLLLFLGVGLLLYLKSESRYTLSIGLRVLQQLDQTNWPLLMAAAVIMTIPVLAMFLIVQRYFWPEGRLAGIAGR